MNKDPQFYVSRARKGALSNRVKDEGPFVTAGAAIHWANMNSAGFKSVTVLRDSRGTDHPDNDGKRFLHSIVK
jgi:hypothetical protein